MGLFKQFCIKTKALLKKFATSLRSVTSRPASFQKIRRLFFGLPFYYPVLYKMCTGFSAPFLTFQCNANFYCFQEVFCFRP